MTTDTMSHPTTNTTNTTSKETLPMSRKLTVLAGTLLALALAVARFAPILAVPLEWQH